MDDGGASTEEGDRFDVGHYISQVGHYALLDLNEGERSWLLRAEAAEALANELLATAEHIRRHDPEA